MRFPKLGSRGKPKLPVLVTGIAVVVLVLGALAASLLKAPISTALASGQSRQIHFSSDVFLMDNASAVKIAGVPVGTVSSVESEPDGSALATVKVSNQALSVLGSEPQAWLRPTTLLGGKYYIDLRPGGDTSQAWKAPVPVGRTRLPVQLGDIAQRLQPDALSGVQTSVSQLNGALGNGGSQDIQQLLDAAPATLRPAAGVLSSAQGTRPATDLPELVTQLNNTSTILTRHDGQLQSILASLGQTSAAIGNSSQPLASTVAELPATLRTANAGLNRLHTTLTSLGNTAGPLRPSAQHLTVTLRDLSPVLSESLPVVQSLRTGLTSLNPVLQTLTPVSQRATTVLGNVRGPVLSRVNGPVKQLVLSPYRGTGPYSQTSGSVPFYQELGYMLSGLDGSGGYVDPNGHAVAFQPGAGIGSVAGTGSLSLSQLYQALLRQEGAK